MSGPVLARLDDVPDGGSAGLVAEIGGERLGLMAIRAGERVFVYVNSCPHIGAPLDFRPGQFLNREGTHILCTNHGALFRIGDGHCVSGPCTGDSLRAIPVEVRGGDIVALAGA